MRSSKSRSRSKANRPRTLGNIINRVFDSSGPEGKVRGTPQQIIEKYQLLARDAQLSNDRVAAENFLQHAEHYTRLLGEAQREMAAEQEERQRQQSQNGNANGHANGNGNGNNGRDRDGWRDRNDNRDYRPDFRDDRDEAVALDGEGEAALVDTPETRHWQNRRDDRPQDGQRNGQTGDRPNGDRQNGNDRRDRNGDFRRRDDRPRDDRPRDQNRDQSREDRPREPRREDRPREDAAQADAAMTSAAPSLAATPVESAAPQADFFAEGGPAAEAAPKKATRAPRKPKAEKPKDSDEGPKEAAE